jgi:hypothetical protein
MSIRTINPKQTVGHDSGLHNCLKELFHKGIRIKGTATRCLHLQVGSFKTLKCYISASFLLMQFNNAEILIRRARLAEVATDYHPIVNECQT